jgi:hypothetical protein
MDSGLLPQQHRYGPGLAEWLVSDIPIETAVSIMEEAVGAIVAAFHGERREVSPEARAALCSISHVRSQFTQDGLPIEWAVRLAEYGVELASEWYMLAVLSIPNLTGDDIWALEPFRGGPTAAVAHAVRQHPGADDSLIVDLIYTGWAKHTGPVSLHLGSLASLAQFSPCAMAAATLVSWNINTAADVSPEGFWEAAKAVASGGFAASETLAALLADHVAQNRPLSDEELLRLARLAGLA